METSPINALVPLLARPWSISHRNFLTVQSFFGSLLARTDSEFFTLSDFITPRPALRIDHEASKATISISGALAEGAPPIWEKLGHTDYRTIRAELAAALDSGVQSVHLEVDSPGGTVLGIAETSHALAQSREQVALTAHCRGMACSAAYHLTSTAEHITASPSADVGNIGVILAFYDDSKFLEAIGVEREVLTNSGADLKGTFYDALTDDQRAFLQEDIDQAAQAFHDHVSAYRTNLDEDEVFRAGWYSGQKAIDLGLIDSISYS